ncbi:hypothetical protein BH18THE2_BH18THE2_13800 [soil metagenome]
MVGIRQMTMETARRMIMKKKTLNKEHHNTINSLRGETAHKGVGAKAFTSVVSSPPNFTLAEG